ncbi:hypothetical protein C8F01DRAFT_1144896 [Mycena amicta]|nr:hypothetical protein C8F01DRAFT_1144896 [Mycena amicta]
MWRREERRGVLERLPEEALKVLNALANPQDPFQSWTPLREEWMSQLGTTNCVSAGTVVLGETSFVLGANAQILDSGAHVVIRYRRNLLPGCAECDENVALDDPYSAPLPLPTIEHIIGLVKSVDGVRTIIEFKTLSDGSFDVTKVSEEPLRRGAAVLTSSVPFPSVLISSLRATHRFPHTSHVVLLVKISPESDVMVLKLCDDSRPANDVEFMSLLPEVDVLLRPTHVVLDDAGFCRGFLSPFHPASSLKMTMNLLHRSGGASIPWSVKLVWASDIAAAVEWLHARDTAGLDIKMENVVLCTDGHCRLIGYCPDGGLTTQWCPPEALAPSWRGSAAGDHQYGTPHLSWPSGVPLWFQSLVSSCLEHDAARRSSAQQVHSRILLGETS